MNFLQLLTANPPIALKPDRPASVHLLSWQQLQLDQASEAVQTQKEQLMIAHSEQLGASLRQKDKQIQANHEKYLQQLLLYQIQNDRLRQILKQWDNQRKKVDQKWKKLEGTYQHRLELLKIEMYKGFQTKLNQVAEDNNKDLLQIRELYMRRLAEVNENQHQHEESVLKMQLEVDRKNTRIQILQAGNQDILSRLETKTRQLKERDAQIAELKNQLYRVKEDQNTLRQLTYAELQRNKEKIELYQKQNIQLRDMLQNLKETIEQLRVQVSEHQFQRARLQESLQDKKIYCMKLQRQFKEFKFRKTQHNSPDQETENNKSSPLAKYTSPKQSSSQKGMKSQSNSHFQNGSLQEKSKKQEKYSVEHKKSNLGDQSFLNEPPIQLQRALQEAKAQIVQLKEHNLTLEKKLSSNEYQLTKAEQKLKQQQIQLRRFEAERLASQQVYKDKIWIQRLNYLQKSLDQLNQEWIKKQRELGTLFKNIEALYLAKLDQKQRVIKQQERALLQKQDECIKLTQALTEKAIQIGQMKGKKK